LRYCQRCHLSATSLGTRSFDLLSPRKRGSIGARDDRLFLVKKLPSLVPAA
jgi:hypothetical protein